MDLEKIFGGRRIVGYAGNRNCGKTNNLVYLIKNFRETNKHTHIYIYGMDRVTMEFLQSLGNVHEINALEQLVGKKESLFIIDEFQKMNLGDRRYKKLLGSFINMIYHPENNNRVIFCSPDLREFNNVMGSKIEVWVVKSIRFKELINGSQLKEAVDDYKGRYKQLNDIVTPKNEMIVLNGSEEIVITADYIKEVDTKSGISDMFDVDEKKEKDVKVEIFKDEVVNGNSDSDSYFS